MISYRKTAVRALILSNERVGKVRYEVHSSGFFRLLNVVEVVHSSQHQTRSEAVVVGKLHVRVESEKLYNNEYDVRGSIHCCY